MFKELFVLGILLLLLPSCFATIFLIEPIDQTVENDGTVIFGRVAKGETLRVIVMKKSGLVAEWDSIAVNKELLPAGWRFKSIETDKTLIAEISLPSNAPVSTQRLEFALSNKSQPIFSESFSANLSVRENLLTVTIENLDQGVTAAETAQFKLIVSNDSIAEHNLSVSSSLPSYWFEPVAVKVGPLSRAELNLNVSALTYGYRPFNFTVASLHNDFAALFPAVLSVKPTLQGKYFAGFFGFPFFSPSLLPYYLLNGFLGLLG